MSGPTHGDLLSSASFAGHLHILGRAIKVFVLPPHASVAGLHGAYSSAGLLFFSPHRGHRGRRARVHELFHAFDELSALHLSHDQVRNLAMAVTTTLEEPRNAALLRSILR